MLPSDTEGYLKLLEVIQSSSEQAAFCNAYIVFEDSWMEVQPQKKLLFYLCQSISWKKKTKNFLFAIKVQLLCDSFDVEYKMVKSKYTAKG